MLSLSGLFPSLRTTYYFAKEQVEAYTADCLHALVKSRRHRLDKVFPAAFESPEHEPGGEGRRRRRFEYMLHGAVELELELKSGEQLVREWAGRAVLTDGEEGLKYALYQVYLA